MKGWYFFAAAAAAVIGGAGWYTETGTDAGIVLAMIGMFVLPVFGIVFGVRNAARKANAPERVAARQAAQRAYEEEREKQLLARKIVGVKRLGGAYKNVDINIFRSKVVLFERFAVRYGDGHVGFEEVAFGSSRYETLMSHIAWEDIEPAEEND